MVIFHSYVSLPEGKPPDEAMAHESYGQHLPGQGDTRHWQVAGAQASAQRQGAWKQQHQGTRLAERQAELWFCWFFPLKLGTSSKVLKKSQLFVSRVGMFSLKNVVKIGKNGVGDFLLSC
jgi:hypothetical protein